MSLKINDKDTKVYIVLGMHHSGTSFISKALHDQGVHMHTRPSAHYELKELVELNTKMIGGDWSDPKPIRKDWSEETKKFLEKYKMKRKWGMKDPRTSLTARHYLPHLQDDDVYLVCVFRKPERVAKSLSRMPYKLENTKEIIDKYNWSIIETIEEFTDL